MLTRERHKNIADLLMLFWYFSIKSHRGGGGIFCLKNPECKDSRLQLIRHNLIVRTEYCWHGNHFVMTSHSK